jgi:hypothetical protein
MTRSWIKIKSPLLNFALKRKGYVKFHSKNKGYAKFHSEIKKVHEVSFRDQGVFRIKKVKNAVLGKFRYFSNLIRNQLLSPF